MAECISKNNLTESCQQETHFSFKDTQRLKVKGWEKIYHRNRNQKRVWVAILVADKIDFKSTTETRDKGNYIVIKG